MKHRFFSRCFFYICSKKNDMNLLGIISSTESVIQQKRESLVWVKQDLKNLQIREQELTKEIDQLEDELDQLKKASK